MNQIFFLDKRRHNPRQTLILPVLPQRFLKSFGLSEAEDRRKSILSKTKEIWEDAKSNLKLNQNNIPLYYFDIENTNKVFEVDLGKSYFHFLQIYSLKVFNYHPSLCKNWRN